MYFVLRNDLVYIRTHIYTHIHTYLTIIKLELGTATMLSNFV